MTPPTKVILKIYDIIEYLILLLQMLPILHESLATYTVRPRLWHGLFFHFRSGPQNRKLAILPWNRLYFGIKIYRESSKSDFESIGLLFDIGETRNTGKTGSFRKFQCMTSHVQYTYHMTPNFTADLLEQIFQNVFFKCVGGINWKYEFQHKIS